MPFAVQSRWCPAPAAWVAVAALSGAMTPNVLAQTQATSRVAIDEIIVQARQREETLLEAPIAVTALAGATIERLALNDLTQMANYVPNLYVSYGSSGGASEMYLRGMGTGSGSAGFSSAVGLLIDGVYFERGRWVQQGYFDVEQVEVLKGPQALYFGKNNSAGLVVLRSRGPGDTFEANLKVGNEFNADERLIEGGVSIPLSDTLAVRLAGRHTRQDGWIRNTSQPQTGVDPLGFDLPGAGDASKMPATRDSLGRMTLRWDATPELEAVFRYSFARNKDNGSIGREMLSLCHGPGGGAQPVFGVPSPFDDCTKNYRNSRGQAAPELLATEPAEFGNGAYFTDYKSHTTSLQLTYELDHFTLYSTTAWQHYDVEQTENASFSDDAQVPFYEHTDWEAWSQEFRLASRFDGPVNVLFGALYTDSELFFRNSSRVAPLPPDSGTGRLWSWDKPASEDGRAWSAYGEVTWDITPTVELATGARYTREKKDSEITPTFVHEILIALGALSDQSFASTFKDSNWSPQATLTWRPSDTLTLYGAYREGFKSGGFDLSFLLGARASLDDLTFDSEEASGWEVGAKTLLLDGRLSVNAAAYRYTFDNMQVQILDTATTTFNIGNAAEARTTGAEVDWNWLLSDSLSFRGALAYNKAQYEEFFAPCHAGQSVEAGCNSDLDPVSGAFKTTDLGGETMLLAPRWVALSGLFYERSIGNTGLIGSAGLDGRYSSSYGSARDRVPGTTQGSFFWWDGSLSLRSADDRWEVSVIGRNLTNRRVASRGQSRALTGGPSGFPEGDPRLGILPDAVVRLERKRQIWLQATMRW